MRTSPREVNESPVSQGAREQIYYTFDFTRWGTPGGEAFAVLVDTTLGEDVSAEKMSGVAVINEKEITSPKVHDLVAGHRYILECGAAVTGNRMSMYVEIVGE